MYFKNNNKNKDYNNQQLLKCIESEAPIKLFAFLSFPSLPEEQLFYRISCEEKQKNENTVKLFIFLSTCFLLRSPPHIPPPEDDRLIIFTMKWLGWQL